MCFLSSVLSIRHTLLKREIQRCVQCKAFKVLGSSGEVLVEVTGEKKISDRMKAILTYNLACTICKSLGVIK